MAETIDTLTVINRALARIGASPLTDTDTDDPQTRQAMAIHEDLVDAIFGLYDWRWARRTVALEAIDGDPFGYSSRFRFPAEALGPPRALFTGPHTRAVPLRDFRVEGRTVAADADALWGTFVCRIDPADWPSAFRLAYTVWLAASLAVPITHDAGLKQVLEQEALGTPSEGGRGGLLGRAIGVDAAGSGGVAPLNAADPLASARFGSGSWSGDGNGW